MAQQPASTDASNADDAVIPHKDPAIGTGALEAPQQANPLQRFLKILGPGFITGASDDDPSGIGTYSGSGESRNRLPG